jgi:hypothetical protein
MLTFILYALSKKQEWQLLSPPRLLLRSEKFCRLLELESTDTDISEYLVGYEVPTYAVNHIYF